MSIEMDPSLLQDFLTESQELIDQLDGDLVRLESADEDERKDILNACFRALHTIKGAASFLGLTEVIEFAHAAEDALNRMRQGDVEITPEIMDVLLQAADVVREQIGWLSQGDSAQAGPPELIATLKTIAVEGRLDPVATTDQTQADQADTPSSDEAPAQTEAQTEATTPDQSLPTDAAPPDEPAAGPARRKVVLPDGKADLIGFMADDLKDTIEQLRAAVAAWSGGEQRQKAAAEIDHLAERVQRTTDFFELDELNTLANLLHEVAPNLGMVASAMTDEAAARLGVVVELFAKQAAALDDSEVIAFPVDTLCERLRLLMQGEQLPEDQRVGAADDLAKAMAVDGVDDATTPDPQADTKPQPQAAASTADPTAEQPAAPATETPTQAKADEPPQAKTEAKTDAKTDAKADPEAARGGGAVVEQTIRVEVGRLEALLNLVGQLVLNKNRVLALTRTIRDHELPQELLDDFTGAAGDLDQLMSELQVGVMRTRMQPLAKLFDRYPRVIRDMARMTQKKIELTIEGKDTEVDKSVLEALADPLVHILRNSADHGVEPPAKRLETGKTETGHIRLVAEHQGSHVRVAIIDDGKGLHREVIGNKAVERGLTTPEQLATLSDKEVFRYIFEAGFSTAEKVSDLSGRGVDMDVVRTNIEKINGEIQINSKAGEGTTIEIFIPLTVAIMPAMVVGVGKQLYSIPLQTIEEIVRPAEAEVGTVAGHPVMRLRNSVLPLVDMSRVMGEGETDTDRRFSVVIGAAGQKVGLLVDRLIGQQEIVIKPLDDAYTKGGPFSGATIREDGEVSLILDVVALMRATQGAQQAAASGPPPRRNAA